MRLRIPQPEPSGALFSARDQMTLNGDYSALFQTKWQAVPTFHGYEWGRSDRVEKDGVSADYTRCGRLVSSYDRNTGKLRVPMTYVPMRHALKFGKPCKRCFPDA